MESANDCCERARNLYRSGLFEQVLDLTAEAVGQYTDHPPLWHFRGLAHHARGEFAEAVAALETLTLLAPLSPSAQVALASSYLATGKPELARTMYSHLASTPGVPVHLLPQLAAGLDCLEEFQAALAVRREWAQRDPGCAAAFFAVAQSMARLTYPADSLLPFLWQAFQLAPDKILYRVDLALLFQRCGNREKAYRLLEAVPASAYRAICCPPRLQALIAVFSAAGDADRHETCHRHLSAMSNGRGGSKD